MKVGRPVLAAVLAVMLIAAISTHSDAPLPRPALPISPEGETRRLLRRLVMSDGILRRNPAMTEEHFDRARTLEALGLMRAAGNAYRKYLKEDHAHRWRAEARRRLRALPERLELRKDWFESELPALQRAALANDRKEVRRIVRRFPQQAREWGEKNCLREWAYSFQNARAEQASQYLTIARAIGAALVTINDEWLLHDAVATIDRGGPRERIALARGHASYASARWYVPPGFAPAAVALAEGGSPMELAARQQSGEESLPIPARYRALGATFQSRQRSDALMNAGNFAGALEVLTRAAEAFASMNEDSNAADAQMRAALLLENFGDPLHRWRTAVAAADRSLYGARFALGEMARSAAAEQQWDIERSLLAVGAEENPPGILRMELLLRQASAAWHDGDADAAKRFLRDAKTISHVQNFGRSAAMTAVTEALTVQSSNRALSLKTLANALTKAATSGVDPGPLPATTAANILTVSLADTHQVDADLVGILHGWGDDTAAFAVNERARATVLMLKMGIGDQPPLSAQEVQRALPPATSLFSFVSLEDGLIAFSFDRNGFRVTRKQTNRSELQRLVAENDSVTLYKELLGWIDLSPVKTLVVIPDEPLAPVPFSTLTHPRTGRSVSDTTDVVVAPSVSAYIRLASTPDIPRTTALVIGDPAFDRAAFPALERLPAAAAEARDVASMYRSRLLVGADASRAAMLASLAGRDVIHIAAHAAVANGRTDLLTRPILSSHDLALQQVRRGSIAILAGCRTGIRSGNSDVSSLAYAFLGAGSRSAVATLWDVDDDTTRLFSRRLHQLLAAGTPVAAAVRRVQLELRSRGFPMRMWGAFQVYGAG